MKDVKKSDSNPRPYDRYPNALTTRLPTAAAESKEDLLYLCTTLLTLLIYTVPSHAPYPDPRGAGQPPNPKSVILC